MTTTNHNIDVDDNLLRRAQDLVNVSDINAVMQMGLDALLTSSSYDVTNNQIELSIVDQLVMDEDFEFVIEKKAGLKARSFTNLVNLDDNVSDEQLRPKSKSGLEANIDKVDNQGIKIYSPSLEDIASVSITPKYSILEEIEIVRSGDLSSLVGPAVLRLIKAVADHQHISDHNLSGSSTNLRNHIYRINQLWLLAVDVFNSEQAAESWMYNEIRALNWLKPVDYLDTAPGIKWLENVLNNLQYGVYS